MLLINDCIANELNPTFSINSVDYLCKYNNIKKLEAKLELGRRVSQNDYYIVYHKNDMLYVIYNASVDDALLNLLEDNFCNDEDIKKISPTDQYALDRITIKLPHSSPYLWLNVMNRYDVLKKEVVMPIAKSKFIPFVKYVNATALRYKRWKEILINTKVKEFKKFNILDFEEILSLASGKSEPIYQKVYKTNPLKLEADLFAKLSPRERMIAVTQLINTYTINEFVVRNPDRKFNDRVLEDYYLNTMMKLLCDSESSLPLRLYIERYYSDLRLEFDPLFYALYKNYDKYVRER